jgi:hypothetical protein
MSDLFMRRSAVISICKLFRYELRRVWNDGLPLLVVCMLNPSWADDEKEDMTLLALIHFATFWGYGGLLIVNQYAYRTASPKEMFKMGAAALGAENDAYFAAAVAYAKANGGKMLVAWGNDGEERTSSLARDIVAEGVTMICLGTTQSGAPKHPMARGKHRIPRDQMPIKWKEVA